VIAMLRRTSFVARLWYYFRMGYATYLTFLFGYVSTLVTVYYLAIKSVPFLLDVFPRFVPFAVLATVIGGPLSVVIGWVHLKRSPAFSSEADINVESNPYNYKLPPGFWREVFAPLYLELLVQNKRLLEVQRLLDSEDTKRIENLQEKLQALIEGRLVGKPRRKMWETRT
jgi:hypothetical protein